MLGETGVQAAVLDQVLRLAELAQAAGLDGVVASPQETALIRAALRHADFAIVTPGIRGGRRDATGKDDQERTMSPAEAIAAGASYIVVGRPIIAAPDPRAAAEGIAARCSRRKSGETDRTLPPESGRPVVPWPVAASTSTLRYLLAVKMKWPRRFCCQQAFRFLAAERLFFAFADDRDAVVGTPRLTR